MVNMEYDVKNMYSDFDNTTENNAKLIASLVRKLSAKGAEFPVNLGNLHVQKKRVKTSIAKRILCSLKIS